MTVIYCHAEGITSKTPLVTVIYCDAEGITSLLYSPYTVEQMELSHLTDHYYINLPWKNANKPGRDYQTTVTLMKI